MTSPFSLPIANDKTDKNNKLDTSGERRVWAHTIKNLFTSFDNKIEIYPGSIIYIPEELDNGYQTRLQTQAYAAILGSLGVSLASLSVLKD